ncbi:MAG: HAD family acid phosphatase [Bacteriovoracaceae bacterium]
MNNFREKAIIFDFDGTLSNTEHREHYLEKTPKDWKGFFKDADLDPPHEWCLELVRMCLDRNYKILIVTGRHEGMRELSETWLKKYQVSYERMWMREDEDHRSDSEIKAEIYKRDIEQFFEILFVVDDRKSVVKTWRELGLTCLQCAPGEF